MEYAPYIAAIAALIAYGLLYRRRKVPKLIRRCNCVCAVLPGGDPSTISFTSTAVKFSKASRTSKAAPPWPRS